MPSSALQPCSGGFDPFALTFPGSLQPDLHVISTLSICAIGEELAGLGATNLSGATVWPAANRALGYMFTVVESFLVRKVFWVNGSTAAQDNVDVAVYTEAGTTRLVSAGSTVAATLNVVQEVDVTDTLIPAGRYWCVMGHSAGVATFAGFAPAVALLRAAGCAQFAGAVPLGTTFTPAAIATAYFPLFGIASRTQVA